MHNLGEGLAIGTSFAIGELQLGAFLVIGFMVHNVTEGLGIAAPATRARRDARGSSAALALIAGAPAILGTWIGGYASNDVLTPALLRARRRRGAPGRRRGRPLRRARGAGRAPLGLGDRRLPRRHRRDVGDRAPGRLTAARPDDASDTRPAQAQQAHDRSAPVHPLDDVLPGEARVFEAAQESLGGAARGARGLWPFLGPAFVASVAYVDPGNFATNMAGGAQFGYLLLWVVLTANLMGMVIQSMSAKLGIATGMNLPEVCRERLPAQDERRGSGSRPR